MQFIYEILSFNRILTVSLLAWFVAQVLKTLINFILLGKIPAGAHVGRRRYAQRPQRHRLRNGHCHGTCEGIDSAIFAVACVVAIITMHDAMGVRHETGEQAKVLNQMIDQWIEVSEKERPVPAEHASEGKWSAILRCRWSQAFWWALWSACCTRWACETCQQGRKHCMKDV